RRELFRRASLAMWYSKRQGANKFVYYTSEIDEKFIEEDQIQKELNRAILQNEFELYYQPIINSNDGSIYGIEALIRWNHPEKGVLKPNYFLNEAEKNDMMVEIGYWVMERAFRDYNTIQNRFSPELVNNIKLSINISPNQFKDKFFVENLKNYIVKYNMIPENICLEITEQVYIQETLRVNELLRNIKKIGCRIAFDDFGIEYSTLSKLQDLNFDVVKIDRKFILGVPHDRVCVEIIKMLKALTDLTGKQLIAEGVDSIDQLNKLREYGCPMIQGFYYSQALGMEYLLNTIYERNIANECFVTGKQAVQMEIPAERTATDPYLGKMEVYESFFKSHIAPVSINRLTGDGDEGQEDILLLNVNSAFSERFLLPGESMTGKGRAAVYPEINDIQMKEIARTVRSGQNIRFPYFYHARTGSTYDLCIFCLDGDKFAMVFLDITESSRTFEKLKKALDDLESVKYMLDISLEIGGIDVWEYDIKNHRLMIIWHDSPGPQKQYMDEYALEDYINRIHPDEQNEFRREFMNYILKSNSRKYAPEEKFSFDYRFEYPGSGNWCWISTKIHIIEYDGINPVKAAAVNVDISQRKHYEETISFQLHHDGLTRLLNREGLKIRLPEILGKSEKCAVAFMDLDNFKDVNDKGGHEAGNKALEEIAGKIRNSLPDGSLAARLSGDEFLLAFGYDNRRELKKTAARILRSLQENGKEGNRITASMGISLYPENSCNESELMSMADKAMYIAKESGKNRFIIHDENLM
ncbi:MAG: EAL domain-containing protein, partial [Clostridia bacterium]|nr:EAL domain-containing protein [Clostridia bacterium]